MSNHHDPKFFQHINRRTIGSKNNVTVSYLTIINVYDQYIKKVDFADQLVTYQFDRRSKFQFNLFSPMLPLHRNQNQHVFGQL